MCETSGNPKLFLIFGAENCSDPLSEVWGAFPQIYCYVKYFASSNSYQFPLWLIELIMQPTQYTFLGQRVIILNKIYPLSNCFLEKTKIKAFIEKAALVTKNLRFNQ